jgi:hypothetical protein
MNYEPSRENKCCLMYFLANNGSALRQCPEHVRRLTYALPADDR